MATVVLGIAAAGVLLPFTGGAAVRAEGTRRTLAAKLAADLVEQILTRPFHEPDDSSYDYNPGPDPGEAALADFDNIDDFHGYVESQGQVRDADGAEFTDPSYANFSRTATCEYVYMPQESGKADAQFILVTVAVYYSGRPIATANRLVGK